MQQMLLAKERKYGKLTLEQHLIDTEEAVRAIFIKDKDKDRILKNWCRFFKVENLERFLRHLQIAALFHDIGKANADFLRLVNGTKEKQTLRHEWISALVLHLPTVRQWLQTSKLDLDVEVITAAVLCHHLKASYGDTDKERAWGTDRTSSKEKKVDLYLDHPEVTSILTKIAKLAEIDGLPEFPQESQKWIKDDQFWSNIRKNANGVGKKFSREVRRKGNENRLSLLLAVKAGLIAADSVASAMFRVKDPENTENWHSENQGFIKEWVNKTLHQPAITDDEIEDKILRHCYKKIEEKTRKPFKLQDFQEKAIDLPSRLLLLSGCGSGKTIFAYKWQQGVVKQQEVGRVIFLYPTRGTATEGFKDYVSWAPETEASLLTGTAAYELKDMQENPSESLKDKDFTTEERLYALGFWGKRFFSATVDQFLSFLTHSYSGMCLLPILADSVLVIDEIHSFSRKMFDNLISFLEHFDIPVLCMTATLPPSRQKEIAEKLSENQRLFVYPTVKDRSELEDLKYAEERPRYIIQSTDYDTAYAQAIASFSDGKRVLWVVNTVNRCRETANKLENELKTDILTYHSRFLLKDRKERHDKTIEAFQGDKKAVIAVTTQVCEMSLDLDADILITEIAPISSLVQRFGRCNRSSSRKPEERGYIWVYEPHNQKNRQKIAYKPYDEKDIIGAQEFLTEVLGEVSQYDLAEKLQEHAKKERYADQKSDFVSGGYWATSKPFREDDKYSVSAILDRDVKEFLKLQADKDPNLEGLILSVPYKEEYFDPEKRPPKFPKYLGIAPSKFYCEKRGFGE
ncbi:CRISPR-associated helicase Cas3' [Crocosphaera sp. Alani8]|uniref:CRISPR-associated helicase Cas3' n=1 Tax=Crocosphaera sp. Alani8 TaxID=3038952 RepID=UPI00313C0B89